VLAGQRDDAEAPGRDRRLQRTPDERPAAQRREVLARYTRRPSASWNEAQHHHGTRSSSIISPAACESASQSGSLGSGGRSRKPQCPSAESRSATGSNPVETKNAAAVSCVK